LASATFDLKFLPKSWFILHIQQPNIENSNIVVHVDENEETENVKSVHFEDIRGEKVK